jgi:hypothetical protein
MQRASLCMVMPSAVLYIALGFTGHALTQGASPQWLQSTGIGVKDTLGNVPPSRKMTSDQLNV